MRYPPRMRPTPARLLRFAGVPALLITDLTNIRYLTGFSSSDGALLVTGRTMTLFLDGRYREAAKREAGKTITIADRQELPDRLQSLRICGIESEVVTIQEEAQWKRKYKNTKLIQTSGVLSHFRRVKYDDELRALRRADRITRQMLQRVPTALAPGIRETDLAWQLRSWAHELGAEDLSFDPIVAFGPHSSRPHHRPGARRLRKRDIVLVDCGARYRGYCGDRTDMFFVGEPTQEQRRALEAVREAKEAAIAAVKTGASTRAIDAAARKVLRGYGMEEAFVHALGHGVGLDIHEGVSLSQRGKDWTLLEHEVITIEPGVYFPGKFGIRLEDMVVVG